MEEPRLLDVTFICHSREEEEGSVPSTSPHHDGGLKSLSFDKASCTTTPKTAPASASASPGGVVVVGGGGGGGSILQTNMNVLALNICDFVEKTWTQAQDILIPDAVVEPSNRQRSRKYKGRSSSSSSEAAAAAEEEGEGSDTATMHRLIHQRVQEQQTRCRLDADEFRKLRRELAETGCFTAMSVRQRLHHQAEVTIKRRGMSAPTA